MNINDIAREAGVSIATISRIINGSSAVSEKTRQKVDPILKKYNYTPNAIARGLVVKSMKTVGILTIDIRDIYYANTVYTIEQELSNMGYNVILCNTGGNIDKKIKYINSLNSKGVDGIILVGSVFKDKGLDSVIKQVAEKIPIVMLNACIEARNIYSILCDDAYAIKLCVEYLFKKGHKDIIYLQDTDSFSAMAKVAGFKEGMTKFGLKINSNSVFLVEKGLHGGYNGVARIAEMKIPFTAIITGEDITALGAVKKLSQLGLKVPEDVAVTGFNNSVFAQCCVPELTSVDSKIDTMATGAARILFDILESRNLPAKTVITPDLVIRGST